MADTPLTIMADTPLTIVAGRPTKILHKPSDDLLVQCRTSKGEDVFVSLKEILALLEETLMDKMRLKGSNES